MKLKSTMGYLGNMTKVKINKYILGSLLPEYWSFKLQVKQPKYLGHLCLFEFTVLDYFYGVITSS